MRVFTIYTAVSPDPELCIAEIVSTPIIVSYLIVGRARIESTDNLADPVQVTF